MDRVFIYGVSGCFISTLLSIFLYQYKMNPFLMFLLPMWGLIIGIAIARVVDLYYPAKKISKK